MDQVEHSDFDDLVLGVSDTLIELETSEQNRQLAVAMARQAERRIRIASRHLDPPIYDTAAFVEAAKALVLRHPRARVEVLVRDSAPILRRGHRLIGLAQRLTTYIEVRRPARQHDHFNGALLLVDSEGYVDRTFSDRYDGTASFNDPRTCRALHESFDAMWHLAEPDPNIRRLT